MKFRKRPVEIEAKAHVPERDPYEIVNWIIGGGATARIEGDSIAIDTLEGTMLASPGDWIIRGVQGEFYPCKPDIFVQTYERAEDADGNPIPPGERLSEQEKAAQA